MKKILGAWRENIEDAFADAKLLGNGASVVSSEGVLLAKFENPMKYAGRESGQISSFGRADPSPKEARPEEATLEEDE